VKNKKTDEKEYIVIVNLVMFFVITAILITIRMFIVINNKEAASSILIEESMYLNYDKTIDFKESNLKLVKAIKNLYGIDVYYGLPSKNYAVSVNATTIQDEMEIFNMISTLIKALSKYPEPFIKEISEKGYKLDIFLVSYFTNGNVALANRNSNNDFKIYLSNTSQLERTVHHEFYHIIDYYIKLEDDISLRYASWKSLNPNNFVYHENINKLTKEYVYGYDELKHTHFVTIYSKFSEKEDRAEVFAESMMLKSVPEYYRTKTKLKSKIELISLVIKDCFKSLEEKNNIMVWEKYL